MKFFKNIFIIATLCTIGSAAAKGLKTTGAVTTPTKKTTTTTTTPTTGRAPQQQPQLQKSTYRQFLTELRNMKVNDVFTPDKSKFTDKIIQFIYRTQISELTEMEVGALIDALVNIHGIGTIITINEIGNPSDITNKKLDNLFRDMATRVEELEAQQEPKNKDLENVLEEEQNLSQQKQPKQSTVTKNEMHMFVYNKIRDNRKTFFGDNAQAQNIFTALNVMFNDAKTMYGNNELTLLLFKEEVYYNVISSLDPTVKQQLTPMLKKASLPIFRDMGHVLEYENQQLLEKAF